MESRSTGVKHGREIARLKVAIFDAMAEQEKLAVRNNQLEAEKAALLKRLRELEESK